MTDFKISDLVKIIEDFRKSRGWLENDNPKNVAMGISVEAGELMEHFVWSDISDSWEISKKQEVSDEIADVFIGLISMTNMLDLDIYEIVSKKLKDLAEEFNLSGKLQSLLKAYNKALSDGQSIKATPDEIQVLKSLAAALRVQANVKATIKLEGHLAA